MADKIQKYDLIFSIGDACLCTQALRNSELQNFSYPFDWLYGSNIYDRLQILTDEFKNWFNKEDLEYFGERQYPHPCIIYKNKKTNIIFNHDFPFNKDFEEAYTDIAEKYNRRIKRLLGFIKKSKKILLVYVISPDEEYNIDKDKLFIYLNKLSKKYNSNFDLLMISCSDSKNLFCEEYIENTSKIFNYTVDFRSETYEQSINSWDFKVLKELLSTFKLKDNRNNFIEFSKIKKGIQISIFPKIPTLLNIFIYILGLRINFYFGRSRKITL